MFTGILIHVNALFGDKLIFFGSINNIYKCMLLKWSYFYCVAISVSVLFTVCETCIILILSMVAKSLRSQLICLLLLPVHYLPSQSEQNVNKMV